ncbi:acyl carrier protein [Anaerocolumna sp. AGMB13025]|uniref:acyl carrier protein n=1 Tax=Anaerocolumna sp. AGMB13025 TaxID=3039116 RepID=UPI00241FB9A9|nr:acyl carrier protein [Anaerocolumna sp. AGMB13025]WFR57123.1 acyl carrier protein [Anaerocolumna sp. AGMB13025]
MNDKLLEILDGTIGKQLTVNIAKIGEKDNLFDYGLDSIGFINVVIELEKQYDIFIDEDDLDLDTFNNIEHIRKYVQQKVDEKEL